MPTAVVVSVADAVRAQIAAASLSQTFTPERSYADWELALEDSEVLHVDVVAVTTAQETELASRDDLKYTIPVHIAVRKKFGADKQNDDTGRIELAEVDALLLLVQEILELFTKVSLTAFTDAVYDPEKPARILVAPSTKALREQRQFTGIVQVNFVHHKVVA